MSSMLEEFIMPDLKRSRSVETNPKNLNCDLKLLIASIPKIKPIVNPEKFEEICPICMLAFEKLSTLPCGNNFCASCIKLLIINYIDNFAVFNHQIICPICSAELDDNTIMKYVPEKILKKMKKIRENIEIQKLVAAGQAVYCKTRECSGYCHRIPNEILTACTICKFTICNICCLEIHPGMSCEEAKELGEDEDEINLILELDLKKCSSCGYLVEKIEGCNFMTCYSPVCAGDYAFCFLCAKNLDINEGGGKHFPDYDTYGQSCFTLLGKLDNDYYD